jgi:aquaporin Z
MAAPRLADAGTLTFQMAVDLATRPAAHATANADRPLSGRPFPEHRLHPAMYAAEAAGTALLVFGGLSVVILINSPEGPVASLIPPPGLRRALAGFLFGSIGAAIAFSPIGRISGAHINPAMTLAFWLEDKLKWRDAIAYVLAQCAGAVVGAAGLLVWGRMGWSLDEGATLPGAGWGAGWAVAGEALCGFLLVALIFAMTAGKATRPYTPLVNPALFCLLVWLEAPISGASSNPARSFGPAVVTGTWQDHWVYWVGPCLGACLAVAAARLPPFAPHRPKEARLFHFGHPGGLSPSVEPGGEAGER